MNRSPRQQKNFIGSMAKTLELSRRELLVQLGKGSAAAVLASYPPLALPLPSAQAETTQTKTEDGSIANLERRTEPMKVEAKLKELGLVLPEPVKPPPGVAVPFAWVRVYGDRAYISGHGPQNPDGSPASPFGRVGAEVSAEQGYTAARLALLSILGSLKRMLGDLDHLAAWLMVSGMVNVAPGFTQTTNVINGGCSDLLLELYGPEVGQHARTAIGVAQLPVNFPVVIAAEVAFRKG
jgi:enamine deaminase RidA (YjgF/YER057c/UK114 family)